MGSGLRIEGLFGGYGRRWIVEEIGLRARRGEVTLLVGPNGSGKSTVLRGIMGLLPRRRGHVIWEGGALDGPTHRLRARGVAYLPQRHPVFSRLSVQGNLELAAAFQTRRGRRREVEAALAGVPALRERRRQLAATLSGGERQQLALACSLVGGPELLLADEPTAGVAGPVRLSLLERLRETARNQDAAVVVVEHHVEAASQVADLVVGLRLGRVAVECEASAFDEAARRRVFLE